MQGWGEAPSAAAGRESLQPNVLGALGEFRPCDFLKASSTAGSSCTEQPLCLNKRMESISC